MDEELVAKRIFEWAQRQGLQIFWGKGTQEGGFMPVLTRDGERYWTFIVWAMGTIEILFERMAPKPPFGAESRRLELLHRLNLIPGVNIAVTQIAARPNFSMSVFRDEATLQSFLDIFEWVLEEVRALPS
jgi:hypothetical protein